MGKFWETVNGKRKRTAAGIAHEYKKYQSSAKAKAERASRNSARRSAIAAGKAHKGDGKDVHHTTGNPMDNSHTRVISASSNRGKIEKSRKRGSRRSRAKWGK